MKKNRFWDVFKKKQIMTALILCALGVGVNVLLSTIVSLFGLPIYLDTVGTIVVAVTGGYLPGVLVGFVTNLVKAISEPSSLYYGAMNVLIAVFASWLASKGLFKKIYGVIIFILASSVIGGVFAVLIPYFMEGVYSDSEVLSGILYETGFFSTEVSKILSCLITELPDKIVTTLLAIGIMKLIPAKVKPYFTLKGWMQAPISEEKERKARNAHSRVMSLQTKMLLVLGISLIATAIAATGIGMAVYNKTIVKEHTRIAQGTATIAAGLLDPERIDDFIENGRSAQGYEETEEQLSKVLFSSTDIEYLYVYKIEKEGCYVVFDIGTDETPGEEPGTLISFDDGFAADIPTLLEGKEIEPIITKDKYGHLLTSYKPVYDERGKCVCYAGADVDMSLITAMERNFLAEIISVFLGFFVLLFIFVYWLAQYQIIIPVYSITDCVNKFSKSDENKNGPDDDVRRIRKLDVHTGDELENLYQSICTMATNRAEQLRSIRSLSESTAKMQDGLIITMADMVENRDSDTGAHVQKTAAYVKIIVEGLKKKGYYAEKITPKFISDVVRSAPLHDVGKIHIPDGILNSPEKLTEEEYEIMKTHTTMGKLIMENAINTVNGDNYLKEARNMAAYHHERWDGKGYPDRLHGEAIPLSARIMAVADVFDALTSARVYKPAFPLEEALSILEQGKETQFDPKCIEVFMDSLEEVKVILRKYNK